MANCPACKRPPIIPIGPSIAYIPLTKNQFAVIDSCDVAAVAADNWVAAWDTKGRCYYVRKHGSISLHRTILGCGARQKIDHVNCNTLDNRRANLRISTHAENCRNRRCRRDNKLGIKGVSLHRLTGKWQAKLTVDGRAVLQRLFDSPAAAAKAYRDAAEAHHGEFARTA